MIKYFIKIMSLNNLHNKQVSGQIATMLTLMMVGMLVLVLIIVNIGDVAMRKTVISNAADAGALQLGSQLSSIANSYVDALGTDKEDCQKTGWGAAIVAAIVAIVAVVVSIVTFGVTSALALMAIGALAGAIGAATTAGIQGYTGKAFWNQVLLGASIGMAVGSAGAALVAAPTAAVSAGSTATVTAGSESAATVVVTAGTEGATVVTGTTTTVLAAGESLTVTVAAGTSTAISVTAGGATVASSVGSTLTVAGAATTEAAASAGTAAPALEGTAPADATATTGSGAAGSPAAVGGASGGTGFLTSAYNVINQVLNFVFSLPSRALNLLGIGKVTGITMVIGSTPVTIGQMFNAALAITSEAYNTAYAETRVSKAMANYSRAINSLGDWDGVKEGTFLNIMGKVVDDPNDTTPDFSYDCNGDGTPEVGGDPCDSDGNGDTLETVPYFQFWWDRRLHALKEANDNAYGFVTGFWSSMVNFKNYVKANILNDASAPNYLSRQEIEGADGEVVNFARLLENAGQNVSFWQVGPTASEFQEYQDGCPSLIGGCPVDYLKDHGFDETDSAMEDFSSFAALVDELESQGLNSAWQYWIDWLYQDPNAPGYDPATDGSYYAVFNKILYGSDAPGEEFQGLYDWQDTINNIETNLTECVIDPNDGSILNAPCKHTYTEAEPYYYATIDSNPNDEFIAVESNINDMINQVLTFVNELENLGNQISQAMVTMGPDFGGYNPVVYSWKDGQGEHKVTVQISSSFKVPSTYTDERGNWWSGEKCVVLKDYQDTTGQDTWVRVKREEIGAADRPVGILGFWRTGGGVIEKTTHVSYNENQVKLVN